MRSLLMNELEPVAYLIYMLAVLLQLKHHRSFRYKVLAVYYAICAVILYIGIVFSEINNWTYNILFFANILVLSKYYLELFVGKIKKKIIISCCIFNALLFIYINIISFKYNDYNNYVYAISFITIVLYSLLYLHQLLINLKEESLLLNFDFWLVCGYLLYFLGSFIIILFKTIFTRRRNTKNRHFLCFLQMFKTISNIQKHSIPLFIYGDFISDTSRPIQTA